MLGLSVITFNPTSSDEMDQLVRAITPLLTPTRDDWLETTCVHRPHPDGGEEDTLYVRIHTGNITGMMRELEEENIV